MYGLIVLNKWLKVTCSVLCFLMGASIYALFRCRQLLGFKIVDALGLGNWIDNIRNNVAHIHLPEFVLFSLPDGLWTIAYIIAIDCIFEYSSRRTRIAWASVIPLIGITSELLQIPHIMPGVFDPLDLIVYIIPITIYILMERNKQ